jgi:hypothetical protein
MTDFDYSDFLNPYKPSSEFNSDEKKKQRIIVKFCQIFH